MPKTFNHIQTTCCEILGGGLLRKMLFFGWTMSADPRQSGDRLWPGSLTKIVQTAANPSAVVSIATGAMFPFLLNEDLFLLPDLSDCSSGGFSSVVSNITGEYGLCAMCNISTTCRRLEKTTSQINLKHPQSESLTLHV